MARIDSLCLAELAPRESALVYLLFQLSHCLVECGAVNAISWPEMDARLRKLCRWRNELIKRLGWLGTDPRPVEPDYQNILAVLLKRLKNREGQDIYAPLAVFEIMTVLNGLLAAEVSVFFRPLLPNALRGVWQYFLFVALGLMRLVCRREQGAGEEAEVLFQEILAALCTQTQTLQKSA